MKSRKFENIVNELIIKVVLYNLLDYENNNSIFIVPLNYYPSFLYC